MDHDMENIKRDPDGPVGAGDNLNNVKVEAAVDDNPNDVKVEPPMEHNPDNDIELNMDRFELANEEVKSRFAELVRELLEIDPQEARPVYDSIWNFHHRIVCDSGREPAPLLRLHRDHLSYIVENALIGLEGQLSNLEFKFQDFQQIKCQVYLGRMSVKHLEMISVELEATIYDLFVTNRQAYYGGVRHGEDLVDKIHDLISDDKPIYDALEEHLERAKAILEILKDLEALLRP